MQLTSGPILSALLVSTQATVAAAARFTLYDDVNFAGPKTSYMYTPTSPSSNTCVSLNGAGNKTSSISVESGCVGFYSEANCDGYLLYLSVNGATPSKAATLSSGLNDHVRAYFVSCTAIP